MIVPDESSPGLFGPRSPRNYEPHPDQPPPPEPSPAPMRQPSWSLRTSLARSYEPHPDQPPPSEPDLAPMRQSVHSWVTWHPNPALAPTPPSIELNLIVPDEGSPGLFGPRSPCSYR
ncbi:hypothetical protein BDR07DRAFT_1495937 [Suillus spraguei]|nr:hypothetical protein BDR07DRAFT_1495937 [Suillus spraguei]